MVICCQGDFFKFPTRTLDSLPYISRPSVLFKVGISRLEFSSSSLKEFLGTLKTSRKSHSCPVRAWQNQVAGFPVAVNSTTLRSVQSAGARAFFVCSSLSRNSSALPSHLQGLPSSVIRLIVCQFLPSASQGILTSSPRSLMLMVFSLAESSFNGSCGMRSILGPAFKTGIKAIAVWDNPLGFIGISERLSFSQVAVTMASGVP